MLSGISLSYNLKKQYNKEFPYSRRVGQGKGGNYLLPLTHITIHLLLQSYQPGIGRVEELKPL